MQFSHLTQASSALAAKGVEQPAQFLNFFVNGDGTPVSAVSIISNLAWGLGYFGMPHILVRFMAVKSNEEIRGCEKKNCCCLGNYFTYCVMPYRSYRKRLPYSTA